MSSTVKIFIRILILLSVGVVLLLPWSYVQSKKYLGCLSEVKSALATESFPSEASRLFDEKRIGTFCSTRTNHPPMPIVSSENKTWVAITMPLAGAIRGIPDALRLLFGLITPQEIFSTATLRWQLESELLVEARSILLGQMKPADRIRFLLEGAAAREPASTPVNVWSEVEKQRGLWQEALKRSSQVQPPKAPP